ncbi:MAG: glycosyltransferase [Promethearchaeota archaeon]
MIIKMILYKYFISDTRVQREAISLAQNGYEIEVINCKDPKDNNRVINNDKRIKNSEIMEVQPKKRETVKSLLKFWFLAFRYLIKETAPPDVIHAHDLTGLPPAVLYKILFPKVKLIYDSHELFPEAAKDKLNKFYWLCFLFLEFICSKFITILIGASPLQLKILKRRIKKPQFCILNVPDLDFIKKDFDYENLKFHPLSPNKEKLFKIIYSGGVYTHRGYDEFILSAVRILERNHNFEFWIVGGGNYLNNIKEMVKKHKISNHFIFTGAVPYCELLKLTYNCDIAVGLYEDTANNNIMISNKIFEYMLVGIPFLFTNLKSSQRYIKMVKAIEIDFPLDPEKIGEKILYLANNEKTQYEISKRSRSIIMEKLNWKNESVKLIEAYSSKIS